MYGVHAVGGDEPMDSSALYSSSSSSSVCTTEWTLVDDDNFVDRPIAIVPVMTKNIPDDGVLACMQSSPQNALCIRCRMRGHFVDQCFARQYGISKKI